MKKTIFTNKVFFWILLSVIGILLIWNLFTLLTQDKPLAILPILVQGTLLALIFTKHEYSKIGIKIWSMVFLVIGPSLVLLGIIFQLLGDTNDDLSIGVVVFNGITLIAGLLIFSFTNDSVLIENEK